LRIPAAVAACSALALALLPEEPGRPLIVLPPGAVEFHEEMRVPALALVEGHVRGSTVRASDRFRGRALFVTSGSTGVTFRDFIIDGNRATLEQRTGLPDSITPFSRFTQANGILAEDARFLRVENVRFREVAGFAVLVARSRHVFIRGVRVEDSGSRNPEGKNNTTGGILLEGGTSGFEVSFNRFRNVRGNGVWTHSRYTDARNGPGRIANNRFETIGRDAVQVGHATGVIVEANSGTRIGFPPEEVDALPVGVDTAGNVDRSKYVLNHFEEINGKCLDLDGFHHGEVRGNVCVNVMGGFGIVMNHFNPDMRPEGVIIAGNEIHGAKFGALFAIGSGNRIVSNKFLNLNDARCGCPYTQEDPRLLEAGIYLARGTVRPAPAHGNIIRDNTITGYGMARNCIVAAPGVDGSKNEIAGNVCRDR
jgi:hypothetical protein